MKIFEIKQNILTQTNNDQNENEINNQPLNNENIINCEIKHNSKQTYKSKINSIMKKLKLFLLIFNICSVAIYSIFSIYTLQQNSQSKILNNIIYVTLFIYIIIFIMLIICNIKNHKRLKSQLKDFKGTIKILEKLVQIINLSLAVMTAFSAFINGGFTSITTIIFALSAITIAIFSILFEIAKIIIRKKIQRLKLKNKN